MRIGADGLAVDVPFLASPNCDDRPPGATVELLVIHAISLPPGEFGGPGIDELFLNRLSPAEHPYYAQLAGLKVSAHFVVRRDGAVTQFVSCRKRAWHAGESSWRGRGRCNDYSIGIELEGGGDVPFEAPQYDVLVRLTGALRLAYPIVDIAGHSEIAPGRKTDPGSHFDWARYRSALAANSTR